VRLKAHVAEEHDMTPGDDELAQTIEREAYDAMDS
jgi:hypothetical protein